MSEDEKARARATAARMGEVAAHLREEIGKAFHDDARRNQTALGKEPRPPGS